MEIPAYFANFVAKLVFLMRVNFSELLTGRCAWYGERAGFVQNAPDEDKNLNTVPSLVSKETVAMICRTSR